jgi:hypothetical protein
MNEYKCECKEGFYGSKCEKSIDACKKLPCKNNGDCLMLEEGNYKYNF